MLENYSGDPIIDRAQQLVRKNLPSGVRRALWLNPPPTVDPPEDAQWRFWQPHHQTHHSLVKLGWTELERPEPDTKWDLVVAFASKHKEENWELLQAAQGRVESNGAILFAVPNDYGAKSYQKRLVENGSLVGYESGRKSRLYRLKAVPGSEASKPPLTRLRENHDGLMSCPGLFSWANIDRGSKLLAEAMKGEKLLGPVADLGAGWGYLSQGLAPSLTVHLFESDLRALEAAKLNLADRPATYHWCDLTDLEGLPAETKSAFATVVTNPPFHSGKREAAEIGQLFAEVGHRFLRRGGQFWMVGNTHLAYPKLLPLIFSQVDTLVQKDGFTVLRAIK